MAKRPILKKQANRVRKALRSQLPAYIDLIQYLKDRGYANTTGEAEAIILAGRVRSESHKLGIAKGRTPKREARLKTLLGRPLSEDDFEEQDVVERFVSAKVRDTIQVLPA